ncbi:hypothetical protein NL676_006430 [Syzygium grande]|nr:hypothetical protein NL676_006430 [Syzygium grande]
MPKSRVVHVNCDFVMVSFVSRSGRSSRSENPFKKSILRTLEKPDGGEFGKYYALLALDDPRIDRLPLSIKVLLESAIRNCDEFQVKREDVEKIIDWENTSSKRVEIPFMPARVLLQDFTGVPALVDLASLRDAVKNLGGDPENINPMFNTNGILYPDGVIGTDSHTTMIDGLGVAGWGVGGIEADAAMLGQPMSMLLRGVVGFRLLGELREGVTATDLVLTVTQILWKHGVVGKFVVKLLLADRTTIGNVSPEYGATMGFFPVDHVTLQYLKLIGRSDETVSMIESYLWANNMFVDYGEPPAEKVFSSYLELDLKDVEPSLSGPKRSSSLKEMKADWHACLNNNVGFTGFAIPVESQSEVAEFTFNGTREKLRHGDAVIAAITSCTNTSNPSVMLGAALLAKKASELGLEKYLDQLGFYAVGYGCTTCIGNSGDLHEAVASAITDIVDLSAHSFSRFHTNFFTKYVLENPSEESQLLVSNDQILNFDGRVHPFTRANYLASPALLVAYALAGTADIDLETEPRGHGKDGRSAFLKDIWPTNEEIANAVQSNVLPDMFRATYDAITEGNPLWNGLHVPSGTLYAGDSASTYILKEPFFGDMTTTPPGPRSVKDAHCLLYFGDSITTDHISPSGSIHKDSPAAKYLLEHGVDRRDFNSYGSRRGNYEVMAS